MMKARMESDLLRAHFAALHLQKAKIIFQKVRFKPFVYNKTFLVIRKQGPTSINYR